MSSVDLVGPFEEYRVVVDGWTVPYLSASPLEDGGIHLQLDHRFGLDVSLDDESEVVPFIADCIAVALGFTCHPRPHQPSPKQRLPFSRLRPLEAQ